MAGRERHERSSEWNGSALDCFLLLLAGQRPRLFYYSSCFPRRESSRLCPYLHVSFATKGQGVASGAMSWHPKPDHVFRNHELSVLRNCTEGFIAAIPAA